MFRSSSLAIFFLIGLGSQTLFSQAVPISSVPGLASTLVSNGCSGKSNLLCAVPNLYGPYGFVLPNPGIAGNFNLSFQAGFVAASATQLSVPALANPASGFVYQYDPQADLYTRTSQSLGPVMTERGETIGRHKFAFGTMYQRDTFTNLDGTNLKKLPGVSGTPTHPAGDPYLGDEAVSTQVSAQLKASIFTAFATYGLTNRLDVSVAVPFEQITFNLNSVVTIHRVPNGQPILIPNSSGAPTVTCCSTGGPGPYGPVYGNYFDPKNPGTSVVREFSNNQSTSQGDLYWDPSKSTASGIGDVTLRFKGNVYHNDTVSMALLTDVRLPTGDASNFLGSGTIGLRPLFAISVREGWFTPHVNLGYQWNGTSILAGDPTAGTKGRLPGFAIFSAGSDVPFSKYVAFSLDYLGQEYVNAERFQLFTGSGPQGTFSGIGPVGAHVYNVSAGAAGVKIAAFNRLLFTANIVYPFTKAGLTQKIAPLVGLSYVF